MPYAFTYRGFEVRYENGHYLIEGSGMALSTYEAVERVIDTYLKAYPEKGLRKEIKKEIEVRKPFARQKGEYSNKQFV